MVPLAVAAGLLIGLSLGALGGGGSILTVPVLMLVVAATMILRRRMTSMSRPPGHPRAGVRRAVVVAATATGVGAVTGFFGVGGGFVVVPALVLVLGFDMPAAAGTSLIVVAVDSAAALAARAGHVMFALDWTLITPFAAAAVLGTLAGTRLAGRVGPQRLGAAFTVLIILVAA